jgi:dephospho-CoA kinase
MARAKIEPYSEAWPRDFARLAKLIRSTLGDRALRIDHIGSTSVRDLDAKDTIDVQVTVADLDDAQPLLAAGFQEFAVPG